MKSLNKIVNFWKLFDILVHFIDYTEVFMYALQY